MLLSAALPSCQKEGPHRAQDHFEAERQDVVNAWLSLNLNVVSSGGVTKAASEVVGGTNNGVNEEIIKRIAVYLVPLEGGSENWNECIMTYAHGLSMSSGSTHTIAVKAKMNVPMNVYVGANLSTKLAEAILDDGPDAAFSSSATSYRELMNEFVSEEEGIAMMCTRPYSVTFIEENANSSTPAEVDGGDAVDLIRMLAKVHVLFQCYDSPNDEFVKITEPGSIDAAPFGKFGWSKLSDISYIVNTVNKSTKLYQPQYGGAYSDYRDLNHSMTSLLEKSLEWEYRSGAADKFLCFAEDLSLDHDAEWAQWSATPERYDISKAPFGSGSAYTNGLYCLENTTDDSALSEMTTDEKKYVPFMVSTHIIVKARFVPRHIISGTDTVGDPVTTSFEVSKCSDAFDFLVEKTKAQDTRDENGNLIDYPKGTFFTRDMKEFYSYDGMMAVINSKHYPRKSFAAYPGGYGFYYSYIYGGNDTSGRVTFTGSDSGVFRNHYHILSCQLMKVPATPGSYNQLMMVNSSVVDWNPKGALNLIVKPNV